MAPCRGSWTTASSTVAITLATARLASLPRPIGPSALQFNQLLQLPTHKSPSSRCFAVIESWKERAEPKCLAGRQLSGNCFGFDPLLLSPTRWTSGLMLRGGDLPK